MDVDNQSYESLSLEEALELSELLISQLCASLLIPWTYARLILENHSWQLDEVLRSAEECGRKILYADCGLPFKKGRSLNGSAVYENLKNDDDPDDQLLERCQGCAKHVLEVELVKMECDHLFCVDCWKNHVQSKFDDKSVTLLSFFPVRCPSSKCGFILDETKMEAVLDPLVMHSFKIRILERFIMTNPQLRLCPNRTCVIQSFETRKDRLEACHPVCCKCKITFCYACALKPNGNCSVRVISVPSPSSPTTTSSPTTSYSAPGNLQPSLKNRLLKQLDVPQNKSHSNPVPRRKIPFVSKKDPAIIIKEKKFLIPFYEMISQQSDRVCYGPNDTVFAIESSAAKTVFISRNCASKIRVQSSTDKTCFSFLSDVEAYVDKKLLEDVKTVYVTTWVKRNCEKYGTDIEWIDGQSDEGLKFCNGFGIAAILRYSLSSLPSKREDGVSNSV